MGQHRTLGIAGESQSAHLISCGIRKSKSPPFFAKNAKKGWGTRWMATSIRAFQSRWHSGILGLAGLTVCDG